MDSMKVEVVEGEGGWHVGVVTVGSACHQLFGPFARSEAGAAASLLRTKGSAQQQRELRPPAGLGGLGLRAPAGQTRQRQRLAAAVASSCFSGLLDGAGFDEHALESCSLQQLGAALQQHAAGSSGSARQGVGASGSGCATSSGPEMEAMGSGGGAADEAQPLRGPATLAAAHTTGAAGSCFGAGKPGADACSGARQAAADAPAAASGAGMGKEEEANTGMTAIVAATGAAGAPGVAGGSERRSGRKRKQPERLLPGTADAVSVHGSARAAGPGREGCQGQ